MIEIFLNLIYLVILIIMVLIGVAFLTLLERKILGYIQIRKGPNKVGLKGLLQPFSDALKLFSKEFLILDKVNIWIFLISPMLMLLISIMYWILYPLMFNLINENYGMILMMMILSLSVYPFMFCGWSSNSIYSMLGCLRVISQTISFEISLFFMMYVMMLLNESFSLIMFIKFQLNFKFFFMLFPLYLMFLISMMIELNRAPFDLIEGESELVSGFNIEYHSGLFSLIFMSEYMMILFMSFIMSWFFLNFGFSLLMLIMILIHVFFFIWIRSIMPRIRYDELMMMCWKKFFLIIMMYLYLIFILKNLLILMI